MPTPRRIHIVGTTGSGKSTLALRLGARLGVPVVELDDLNWEPGWREADHAVFAERVRAATAGDGWVVCGNYKRVREVFWPRTELVVCLDYPFPLVFARLVRRTFRRWWRQEACCNGNYERLWVHFCSRDSLWWWCIKTWRRRHGEFMAWEATPETLPAPFVRHTLPKVTERWLSGLE